MKKIASRFGIALMVLIGAFLLIISIEPDLVRGKRREPLSKRDAIPSLGPDAREKKDSVTPTTMAPRPPPSFTRPNLPATFQRLEGARHAPDEMYAEWLENKPRTGPTPRNLGELDEKMDRKRREFGNSSDLDHRLKFLDALDTCAQRARLPEGSVIAALWFEVAGNVAKPSRVTYEATTLPPAALEALKGCIHQSHVSLPGFTLKPEPGATEHVWPTTITIPLKNHELYHWLDAEPGTQQP